MTLVYPKDDFPAYLTAVLQTWLNRAPEWAIVAEGGDWFGPTGPRKSVTAEAEAARRMADGVRAQAGMEAWLTLGHAFRHVAAGKEALLTEFIRLCVQHKTSVLERLDPEVTETVRRARSVRGEAHRFVGLLRFQAVDGGWYGRFEPDHDVLGMLVGTFHRRFAGEPWMLHDVGRGKAWVCRDGVGEGVTGVKVAVRPGGEIAEAEVQILWRRYFQTIAIEGRLNPTAQRSKMPIKTWKNLVETPGPSTSSYSSTRR